VTHAPRASRPAGVIDFRSQPDRPGGEFDAGRIRPEALPLQGRTLRQRRAWFLLRQDGRQALARFRRSSRGARFSLGHVCSRVCDLERRRGQ